MGKIGWCGCGRIIRAITELEYLGAVLYYLSTMVKSISWVALKRYLLTHGGKTAVMFTKYHGRFSPDMLPFSKAENGRYPHQPTNLSE